MSRTNRVVYETIQVGRRQLVPIQYIADDYITAVSTRIATKLHRAGTVGIIDKSGWDKIQSTGGAGLNVDPAYF